MNLSSKRIFCLLLFFAAVAGAATPAFADVRSVDHGGTYFGSVVVEPGQDVDGDLTVIFGDATIEGTVHGDVNVIGGSAIERPGAMITGQVNTLGSGFAQSIVPWVPNDTMAQTEHYDYPAVWRIAWDVVLLLVFLLFPARTRMALARIELHPGLATVAGLLGWVAVIPLALLLLVTIVLIPVIALEFIALAAGLFIGQAALSLLLGRRLIALMNPTATPSPIAALLLGMVILTAAELMPIVGWLVMGLVWLVGLGAAILTFVDEGVLGTPRPVPSSTTTPPIGGPPMVAS